MAEEKDAPFQNPEYEKNPEKYHLKCLTIVDQVIKGNPFFSMMVDAMKEHGCEVTPDFFKCRPCPIKIGGLYDSKLGIVLCENNITFKRTLESTMMHELVHAFDTCRADISSKDCLQTACAEIRAANLSGECSWSNEVLRGQLRFQKQYPACVKRRATAATATQPHCGDRAPEYIEAAWRSCYRDTTPYGFVPL